MGDRIRVRPGVRDPEYPDIPLGGWAGTVSEVHDDGFVVVRWSDETLASVHPVYRKRCEKDGEEFESYCLEAGDLEPDAGGPLQIEQPTTIRTKPLSTSSQDDRIRIIFGLTSDDPLPDVGDDTLAVYHEHFSKRLAFPFLANYGEEYGRPERVEVLGLGDPGAEPMVDEEYGILCEARMAGEIVRLPLGELDDVKGKPNRQLIADYCRWFWNWR